MANITETATWEPNIYRIDPTDAVTAVGGDTAIDNIQAKQLADRTQWLKQQIANPVAPDQALGLQTSAAVNANFVLNNSGRFSAINEIDSATELDLDNTYAGNLLIITQTTNANALTIKLPKASTMAPVVGMFPTPGSRFGIGIAFYNASAQAVSIAVKGSTSDKIVGLQPWLADDTLPVSLMPGERLFLVANSSKWYAANADGSFNSVGRIEYYPTTATLQGLLECKGQTVLRTAYPRLWAWLVKLNLFIADGSWSAATTPGQFSTGDGATTFRLPDLRGLFIRSLDDSAGIDAARVLGSYQADDNKAHSHEFPIGTAVGSVAGSTAPGNTEVGFNNTDNPGSESRPKNVALTAYIRY